MVMLPQACCMHDCHMRTKLTNKEHRNNGNDGYVIIIWSFPIQVIILHMVISHGGKYYCYWTQKVMTTIV